MTVTRLAQDVNALVVTFQNPRDFHGHDLLTLLENYLLQVSVLTLLENYLLQVSVLTLLENYPFHPVNVCVAESAVRRAQRLLDELGAGHAV